MSFKIEDTVLEEYDPEPGVTDVRIPEGITEIDCRAFYGCAELTSVCVPEGVTEIGSMAFQNCEKLASVCLPASLKKIGGAAFSECTGLTSINLPEGLETISGLAFCGCSGLTDINLPKSLRCIGAAAFVCCEGLTSVSLPEGLSRLGGSAFCGCSRLTSVSFPKSLKRIGHGAFDSCGGLTSITFSEDLETIGGLAFQNCTGLTTVSLPKGLREIGEGTFFGCSGLSEIRAEPDSEYFYTEDGILYSKDRTELIAFPGGKGGKLELSENVTIIDGYAFSGSTGLLSVHLPKNLTEIRDCVFLNCSGLSSVTLPESVTEIGHNAFQNCIGLTSISLPKSVIKVGDLAFCGCTGLKDVYVQGYLKISDQVFYDCSQVTVHFPHGTGTAFHAKDFDFEDVQLLDYKHSRLSEEDPGRFGRQTQQQSGSFGDIPRYMKLVDRYAHLEDTFGENPERRELETQLLAGGSKAQTAITRYLVNCGQGWGQNGWWNGAADLTRMIRKISGKYADTDLRRLKRLFTDSREYHTQVTWTAEKELLALKKENGGYIDGQIPAEYAHAELLNLQEVFPMEERLRLFFAMQSSVNAWSNTDRAFYYFIAGVTAWLLYPDNRAYLAFYAAQTACTPNAASAGWKHLREAEGGSLSATPESARRMCEKYPLPKTMEEAVNYTCSSETTEKTPETDTLQKS